MARMVSLARSEVSVAALLAALSAAFLVGVGPPGGDAPAHLYRTLLVREGFPLWDNLWFAGQYPLASYSLLYYLPAALVGNEPLVFAAAVISAALFASLVEREWGDVARWPARAFAVVACGPLFTGTYSYALGLASALGSVRALQAGRTWPAVGAAALTLGFSPLAFVFLCLLLAALVVAQGRLPARTVAVGGSLLLLAGLQAAALVVFPTDVVYPFRLWELLAVLGVSFLGAVLAGRSRGGRVLAALFVLWAAASLAAYLVPSPIGENVTRLRSIVFPLMLLAALLARFRPRWLAVGALVAALAYNVAPYASAAAAREDVRPAREAFWKPVLAFLEGHSSPGFRVEVVPTLDHWETYWLPRAGFALARGWYRQIDFGENRVLYRTPLEPGAYRRWLRRMGVRFVVLPNTRLGYKGADREARLLRSGRSGLVQVYAERNATIYELPGAVPILTGAALARITELGHASVEGWTAAPGVYRLRLRYTRYWQLREGALCVDRAPDGMTLLRVRRSGRFALAVEESPAAVLRTVLGRPRAAC